MKKIIKIIGLILACVVAPAFANYAILMDAGSSGTRLYLFEYQTTSHAFPHIEKTFEAVISPGLSAFEREPQQVGSAIQPLLDQANTFLIQKHIDPKTVSVSILATAGMRLLPESTQEKIYAELKTFIQSHYAFPLRDIKTISGQLEGLFGWLDVNYLMQNLQHQQKTVGSIDMGGASTQITFETPYDQRPNDTITLRMYGKNYHVFSKSFFGMGMDQARNVIKEQPLGYTCYANQYPLPPSTLGKFNFQQCESLYANFIQSHQVKENIIKPDANQRFVGLSGIYYIHQFFGIHSNPSPENLTGHLEDFCHQNWEDLQKQYPNVPIRFLSIYCADGTYIGNLLYNTYQLNASQLTITDKINNQTIEWTLGALLYQIIQDDNAKITPQGNIAA